LIAYCCSLSKLEVLLVITYAGIGGWIARTKTLAGAFTEDETFKLDPGNELAVWGCLCGDGMGVSLKF